MKDYKATVWDYILVVVLSGFSLWAIHYEGELTRRVQELESKVEILEEK